MIDFTLLEFKFYKITPSKEWIMLVLELNFRMMNNQNLYLLKINFSK